MRPSPPPATGWGCPMSDPTTTLRALADACEDCDRFDRVIRGRSGCDSAQRDALMLALPRGGWPETAAELRAMADEVERLRASRARWSVAAGIAADTLCPQCGLGVRVDEDGCCRTCGATATGDAVESRRASIEAAEAADAAAGVSDV